MPTIPPEQLSPGVEETSDFLVFLVASSRPEIEPHRVDLQTYCGNGSCTCEHFKFKLSKFLIRRAMPDETLECRHIKRAKRYLYYKFVNRLMEDREMESHANKIEAREKTRRMVRSLSRTAPEVNQPIEDTDEERQFLADGKDADCPF
jgi:hypothetical protein